MPYVNLNESNYFIETYGQGRPLVLLHGFTGSVQNWSALIPALAQTRRVIAIDLLGHGSTDAPDNPERYRIEAAADDLRVLIESTARQPVDLLGYSMGGRLALATAARHPGLVRSLILESASPGLAAVEDRAKRAAQDRVLADRIEADGIEAFVESWEALPLWESQAQLSEVARRSLHNQRLNNRPGGLANSLRGMGTGEQPSLWAALPGIEVPTLLITGELDTKFSDIGADMQALLPHAQFVVVANAGHTVHLEQPDVYLTVVSAWLERGPV